MKKQVIIISLSLVLAVICFGCSGGGEESATPTPAEVTTAAPTETLADAPTETPSPTPEVTEAPTATPTWSPSTLLDGLKTSIEYDKKYNSNIKSKEDAIKVVKMYGDMQKETYNNPEVSAIETKMEEEFDIAYVALGELDKETAEDIYAGFKYMYDKYPELKGTLTDFTLGNFTWSAMAQTRCFEFMLNQGGTPIVLKNEIIISASSFLDRNQLISSVKYNEETGFWPKNASVSMIIVHELGHHLLDVHNAKLHGFSGNYVTDENYDAYRDFTNEALTVNQDEVKRIMADAYAEWSKSNKGSEEDFRASISGYAKAIQSDGGISYTETFAEAVADIYANGDNAAEASKLIIAAME